MKRIVVFGAMLALVVVEAAGTQARVAVASTSPERGDVVSGAGAFVGCVARRQVNSNYTENPILTLLVCAPRLLTAE